MRFNAKKPASKEAIIFKPMTAQPSHENIGWLVADVTVTTLEIQMSYTCRCANYHSYTWRRKCANF